MPHIQDLTVKNCRVLKSVSLKGMQPLNVGLPEGA